ncbi:MAG: hypothetical protein WKF77_31340 [Planctomycetaceae bacterium]
MMNDVKYLIFDIETVGDGDLIRKVRYPEEDLTPREAVTRYRRQLLEEMVRMYCHSRLCCRFQSRSPRSRRLSPAGTDRARQPRVSSSGNRPPILAGMATLSATDPRDI